MIGDVLTSSVMFEALRQKYPNAQLDYLINEHTFPVVQNNPFIDNYIFFTKREDNSKRALLKFALKIRKNEYDVVIDVYAKLSSFLITSFSKAKTKISYYKSYSTILFHHNVKRRELVNPTDNLAVFHRLDLLKPLGIESKRIINPGIYLSDTELYKGKEYLLAQGINFSRPLYMISVLGSSENKTYPFNYMATVIDVIALEKTQCQILFNYLPQQKKDALAIYNLCEIKTQKHILLNIFGNSLREFLAIAHHCDAIIGNEGGAVNMAKALHVRTFSIFSPWIDKATWNLFENENNVSVHLKDYKPEIYTEPEKTYKKESLNLYKEFKPNLFTDKLMLFLRKNTTEKIKVNSTPVLDKKNLLIPEINKPQVINLSAVIITLNEEEHLEKCLKSIVDVVDEIVVVDSFSTDKTEEICAKYNVRFIQNKFEGYIEQKNFALSQAKHDYILSLDGDEALSETLKKSIIKVKNNWKYDGYYSKRLNNYCGQWIKHSDWYPDRKLRLFKKGNGEWKGINPHDTYVLKKGLKSGRLKGDLLHWIYRDYQEHNLKVEQFSTIAAKAYYLLGIKSSIFKILLRPSWAFFKSYFLRFGFLDGLNGLIISVQAFNVTFLKYIKLRELYKKNNY